MIQHSKNFIVKQLIKTVVKNQQLSFLNWEDIETIALIVSDEEKKSEKEIEKLARQFQKKNVKLFYIQPNVKQSSKDDWNCIAANDLNILKLPKTKVIQQWKSLKFDLVINTTLQKNLISICLATAINSKCKIATNNYFNEVNLIIQRTDLNLETYIQEVIKYLKMIKN